MSNWDFLKPFRFFDIETGVIAPGLMVLPNADAVEANTPSGHAAMQLVADHLTQRVDVNTGELVPYTPPPMVIVWDAPSARAERDRRMADADWVTLRAVRTGQPIPQAWAAYMQALADVPDQPGFPDSITWPTPPSP